LLTDVAAALRDLSAGGVTADLADRFVAAAAAATPQRAAASHVPVVDQMRPIGPPLRDALLACTDELPWRPSPRVDDGGAAVALLDFGEILDLGSLTVGAMAVGPHAEYPVHDHPPLEMYLVLGGTAAWRHGGVTDYVDRHAGDLVVNHPNDRHGVRTADDALLAVYVLDT
jgi:quercetin dioxygenase-like cupin family protein